MLQLLPFALALAAQRVAAHGGIIGYGNAGTYYPGFRAYNTPVGQVTIARPYATFNPIESVTDSTLSCNNDGQSGPNQLTATVEAGSDVTFYWNEWPHNTGPIITYLAQCPGETCTGVDSSTLKWFKIDEAGLMSGTIAGGAWAAAAMMANNNSWTSTIPSEVPSGEYIIRHETIALHSLPAQMYPECAQIKIVNGGSRAPTEDELVTFPSAYSNTDPGLTVNIHDGAAASTTSYVVPGPPLYGSGSGSAPKHSTSAVSSAAPVATSSAAPVEVSSAAPVETSSAAPVETSATSPVETTSVAAPEPTTTSAAAPVATSTVSQWGQCGGNGFTGSTTCASPFVCTKINDYYSQCLTGALSSQFSSAPAAAQPTASATPAVGSVAHYGQCGGINHKGDTACVAPFSCIVQNKYYHQCI